MNTNTQASIKNRRQSRIVVEKDFQYRFTLRLCLIGGAILLAVGGLALLMLKLNYEMLRDNALVQMSNAVPSLTREFRMYSLGFIGALILCIAVLFVFGLVVTQRIAGPLIALQRRLKDFADGKEGVRLRLRKDDEFHNLEALFNLAMETHDKRSASTKAELQSALDALDQQDSPLAKEKIKALLGPQ